MHTIEKWWRNLGCWDRQQVSGILYENYDGEVGLYLDATDRWWDSLTDTEKKNKHEEFFEEY